MKALTLHQPWASRLIEWFGPGYWDRDCTEVDRNWVHVATRIIACRPEDIAGINEKGQD